MFASSLEAVLLTHRDGGIIAANPAACQMLGYEQAELSALLRADLVDTSDPRVATALAQCDREGAARGVMVFTRKDQSMFAAEVSSTLFLDEQGLACATMFLRDISGRARGEPQVRESEERLRQLTAELEFAKRELETFSYSVSHDLRGPLNVIAGFSQLIATDHSIELPETTRNYLKHIDTAAQRMQGQIADIMKLVRIGRADLTRMPLDMTAMAHEIAQALRARDPARKAEVHIADGLHVHADAPLVRIVLENLLGNAWKYSSKRADAKIEFSRLDDDTFLIRDNGVGFEMKDAERIFCGFQRLHADKAFKGNGMGLSLVQRVVQRHGGRVWAEAVPGAGTTIFFRLSAGADDSMGR